ncbi:hypothetical protein HELRODRAFT_155963 [Helobdella robusta]|uniref:Large ribosomal subunit protein bL28m n=1 Tax=Helobdella robusta TaxID=6412 RepID=T1ELP9_HELRO|nr:hypothetical protein HELRODRAFT_155963 [Helobdella robusta]ESN99222.1 hypothetical protein HELRODRAFT_155963 [Helobdella robusta]
MQKLHRGIWPWTKGLKSRLPLHYKIRYTETWMKTSQPVHYREESRKFLPDEFNQPVRVQNIPIPITFPLEADHGLWGGEGIIAGLKKKKNSMYKPRTPTIWKPFLTRRVLYSEILDKYFDITVTLRTLNLIDECYGFDFYILKTHEVDLKSKLGMTLKRTMLIALSKKSFYPDNPKKQKEIYEKYKEYEIPLEEAEWVGLSLQEAERKQHEIEEKSALQNEKPLKHYYADDLLKEIKENDLSGFSISSQNVSSKFNRRQLNFFL